MEELGTSLQWELNVAGTWWDNTGRVRQHRRQNLGKGNSAALLYTTDVCIKMNAEENTNSERPHQAD